MADTGMDAFVTFIYSPRPERAWHFYGETLGLELARDEGEARIYAVAGKGYLGVCRAGPERPSVPEGVCLSLVTDQVDAWHARLVAAGVVVTGPPEHLARYGVTSFFFRDPDGHLLEVQRFDQPFP